MALSIFNPVTLENRPATEEELAALYRSASDKDSTPVGGGLGPQSDSEDEAATTPRQNGGTSIVLDWETHLYDFTSGEVVPIHVPLSQQFGELRETLGKHIETLESRVAGLEAQLGQQADSLLGFAATIEHLVYRQGESLPEFIAQAQERIRNLDAQTEPRPAPAAAPPEGGEEESGGD